tara:strand:- start:5548 stop:5682 length:135 start_codon:yes stop_codon:yes gene_type:complete
MNFLTPVFIIMYEEQGLNIATLVFLAPCDSAPFFALLIIEVSYE